ncbi:DUF3307 domain-containing protein [Gracilimonas mengyeensis]|uniref:DUF3307 domain-containing protein n=1 Tax=Gracilimonas mengyeensis TaxID=1302730 RepID=A0A521FIR2_9BACT|nr:DUF3307 domain-containing protein [Gracilimonas mengyeensis]SMO95460.1 Protein of unknown function [Gracilimonas mengyeensis]
MIILLKLLLAHLIGDFGLQFKKWVDHKRKYRLKSGYLYLHVAIHAVATLLLLWPEISRNLLYLWIPAIVLVTHFMIDAGKLMLRKSSSKNASSWDTAREQILFFADQFLHVLVIFGIWFWVDGGAMVQISGIVSQQNLLLLLCLFFLTQPAAIIIKILIAGWLPKNESKEKKTLANAGRYIGILERLFVFGFVVSGNWSGIGFLLAAKSVFRFGDLKEKEGIKLTEYILIGTLLSFGLAMLVSILYLKVRISL